MGSRRRDFSRIEPPGEDDRRLNDDDDDGGRGVATKRSKRRSERSRWIGVAAAAAAATVLLLAASASSRNRPAAPRPSSWEGGSRRSGARSGDGGPKEKASIVEPAPPPPPPPDFITLVLPDTVKPRDRSERRGAIADKWGEAARVVFAVHDKEDDTMSPVIRGLSRFPQTLLLPPSISEEDGVDRDYYSLRTVHQLYDPDFVFVVADHTFVIPEHLCHYLADKDPNEKLYAGDALKIHGGKEGHAFNSPGSGYLLSRSSLKGLVEMHRANHPKCVPEPGNKWFQSNSAVLVGRCLTYAVGSLAVDALDDVDGSKLFHAYGFVGSVLGKFDDWYVVYKKNVPVPEGTEKVGDGKDAARTLPVGRGCCSSRTVSFHYVESKETRTLHELRRHIIRSEIDGVGSTTDEDVVADELVRWWPRGNDLGGYSAPLPKPDDPALRDVAYVLRKISAEGREGMSDECLRRSPVPPE